MQPTLLTLASDLRKPHLTLGRVLTFPSLTRPGEHHRLLFGDCRQPESWAQLLHGRTASNIFTSPVYADRRRKTYGGPPADQYVEWFDLVQQFARKHLADDGSFFINIKAHVENGERLLYDKDLVLAMCRRWGWKFIDDLAWKRQGFPGRFPNRFKNAHEPVFHFGLKTAVKFRPQNVLKQSELVYATGYDERGSEGNSLMGPGFDGRTGRNVKSGNFQGALPNNVIEAEWDVLDIDDLLALLSEALATVPDEALCNTIEAYTGAHSPGVQYGATFPVALAAFFIQAFSDPGDLWVDPFGGSGTTMQAAEENGRIAYLIDNNATAVQRTIERMALAGVGVSA